MKTKLINILRQLHQLFFTGGDFDVTYHSPLVPRLFGKPAYLLVTSRSWWRFWVAYAIPLQTIAGVPGGVSVSRKYLRRAPCDQQELWEEILQVTKRHGLFLAVSEKNALRRIRVPTFARLVPRDQQLQLPFPREA